MADTLLILFAAVAVAAVCHVKLVPFGRLDAVILPKLTIVAGQVLLKLVLDRVGVALPAIQLGQVFIVTVAACDVGL